MNFHTDPDHPGQEQEWHRRWKERGEGWLERLKPILEQQFTLLAAQPEADWPIVKYDARYPLWRSFLKPEQPPPWRLSFVGMSGPGMTEILIAFSALPPSEARERLKQELIKDVAMLDATEGGL
jgi:hypothetical protein